MPLLVPAPKVILGADGTPQPPTEIVRRLRQVRPDFNLRPAADGTDGWWVVREWRDDDPRRAMIHRQEIAPEDAYDLFVAIPRDCPVWEVPNYLMRRLERTSKRELRAMLADLRHYNEEVRQGALDTALAEPRNRLEVQRNRLFNLARVVSAGIPGLANGPAPAVKG